ncbi:mycothiol transferase [Quadrisphaera setariae]|uniref:DinB family protein n=1 Tax=Quadrisphaera setariae TaxID=2593304 RepID=A0A5C8ZGW4_9ACTN|nr:DinB family protein [Quadrisphaera setariae]TXR57172.1 DinB family protein [Quadrisphaera setariae]
MDATQVLQAGLDQVRDVVVAALDELTDAQLVQPLEPGTNTVAWLVWHLVRVQDDHVAHVAGADQVWTSSRPGASGGSGTSWARRFDLPLDDDEIGYGFDEARVLAVKAPSHLLRGYLDAVHQRTSAYLAGLSPADLDRVVDTSWDPPVTLGVRLTSVLGDDLQHAGQAAYAAGVLRRR